MGNASIAVALIVAALSVFIYFQLKPIFELPQIPEVEETWWGKGDPKKTDTKIRPFKIDISDEILNDLQRRLNNALPFQDPLEGVNQNYGTNTKLLTTVVDFWKTKYNWRERETFLNQYPQYKVNIQGLDIHYLHVKPKETKGLKVRPLLLLHGWPGSVREFYEIIPLLTMPQKGNDVVFEVIIPSLPGYGFSDPAVRPGLNALHIAVIFKNLMKQIGFQKYYIQGGDWGGLIVSLMAAVFPENVLGVHSNMCHVNTALSNLKMLAASMMPSLFVDEKIVDRMFPLKKKYANLILETGYMHLQATKPDTVGVALRDSPVGLAAYILEKFTTWTNSEWKDLPDGGLTKKFTMTQLLDNVMIYWVTRSITTSMRLYAENFSKESTSQGLQQGYPIDVPSGCARFKYDFFAYLPEFVLREKYRKLLHVTDYDAGHFAAFEEPKLMADDIYEFVKKVENAK